MINFQRYINFIVDNKEWLFSGIGVSVLVVIFLYFKKLFLKNVAKMTIILDEKRKRLGCSSGGGETDYYDIRHSLLFRVRNQGDKNICLEDVRVKNALLGNGKIDRSNPRLSKLPYNIDANKTEEVHLLFTFPNGLSSDIRNKNLILKVEFDFGNKIIEREVVVYLG